MVGIVYCGTFVIQLYYTIIMNEKKRTDYSKIKQKSDSSSVRFNLEHLDFIKKREVSLKTSQQVVDFLLEAYYKTYSVQPSNPFEVAPAVKVVDDIKGMGETVEIKKPKKPVEVKSEATVSSDEILRQIEAIKAEKIPQERNTALGKKVWQNDQAKKIKQLENQLNQSKNV